MTVIELKQLGACPKSITYLESKPDWVTAVNDCDNLDWFEWLLERHGALWVEYEKIQAPARAEYNKVEATAWAEYRKIEDTAWAEYRNIEVPALAEYEKATTTALAEYK